MLGLKVLQIPLKVIRDPSARSCRLISPAWTSQVVNYPKRYSTHTTRNEAQEIEVYVGPLSKNIRGLKLFSLVTSAAGVMAQPVLYNKASELNTTWGSFAIVAGIMGFFTFATPILINIVTRKYVTSLVYNPEDKSYTAKVYNILLGLNKIKFTPEDVKVPETGGFMCTFIAKKRPLFIDAKYFSDMSHYKKIMGYDKPLDFKLEGKDSEKKT